MSDDLVARLLDGIVAPEGAFNDDPPIWAQDPFNGDTAEKCGRCDAWRSVVRPGKTQCDYCCDSDDYGLRIKAAQALTEARAEIERLREQVFELEHGVEDQMEEAAYHAKQRAAAESELSTLRARVREVVGPFARYAEATDADWAHDSSEIGPTVINGLRHSIKLGHLRAARQLMEEVK